MLSTLKILAFLLLLSLFIKPISALAQTNTSSMQELVGDGQWESVNKDNWSAVKQTSFTYDNMMCGTVGLLIGWCPYDKIPVRTISESGQIKLALVNKAPGGGALGAVTGTLAALYNPPTSSVQYLADLGKNWGLAKPAYAQQSVGGSGAGIIAPVKSLWQAVRNISYLVFIIVFIVVGFMIMFRQKINPQTVISAQAALPGLVVGLLLVTFSYFIAALIIDFSFVGIQLVAQIIGGAAPNAFGSQQDINNLAQHSSVFQLFGSTAIRQLPGSVGDIFGGVFHTFFGSTEKFTGGSILTTIAGVIAGGILGFGVPGALVGGAVGAGAGPLIVSGAIALLIPLVLLIALFIQMIRLLFNLIGTYIQLLVAVITGPLVILVSSVPGRGGGISNWLKGLVANSLIFPAVFAGFLFAGMILKTDPGAWKASPPLFGGLTSELLRVLIAYGILLALPSIPDAVRKAFKIEGQPGIAQAALGGFMGGVGLARGSAMKGYTTSTADLKAQREVWQKGVTDARVAGTPHVAPGGVPAGGWKERLFKRGLP
ncbi:hypothetical protein HY385_01450 [Candidatus Daviesbacteria bacterium]|nr:hypothetical protein [Candidatus Daviesbacteria bacterium]